MHACRWDLACVDADSALQLDADSLKGHLYKGIALEHRGLFEQALACFVAAVSLQPAHAAAGEGVARCRSMRGENLRCKWSAWGGCLEVCVPGSVYSNSWSFSFLP